MICLQQLQVDLRTTFFGAAMGLLPLQEICEAVPRLTARSDTGEASDQGRQPVEEAAPTPRF